MKLNIPIEDLEDIDDTAVLNKVRGLCRATRQAPKFREKVDVKRYKTQIRDSIINRDEIEMKTDFQIEHE